MGSQHGKAEFGPPVVMGTEDIMCRKAHGTSATPVQKNLRWNCDFETADRICNYNRHYAEHSGYFRQKTTFVKKGGEQYEREGKITFYDSNTGKPLFFAPVGRSWNDFLKESDAHGWPSFRDGKRFRHRQEIDFML